MFCFFGGIFNCHLKFSEICTQVRKCCNVCFPELLKVLDDLQVTIIYARPQGVAELDEPIEHWKEAAFRTLLQASYERPLPPQLARSRRAAAGRAELLANWAALGMWSGVGCNLSVVTAGF